MCKLCNSDRPVILHYSTISKRSLKVTRLDELTTDALCIIREYIGESICLRCRTAMLMYMRKYGNDKLDHWVVNRLYLFHSKAEHRSAYNKEISRKRNLDYKKATYIGKIAIEQHISFKPATSTFLVAFNGYGKKISKTFKTLEEAQHYKQEILNGKHNSNTTV